MTPGGPGSNNASTLPSKKTKAAGVGKINHQDQLEDKNLHKKSRKQIATEGDEYEDAPQGSRETSRKEAGSGLQSQKRGSTKAEPKALRQSQNSKIGMGSQLVNKKQVKGKSTPAHQVQHDDADEYAEDEFEDANNHEDHEPTPAKNNVPKKAIQQQRSREPQTEADYLNQNNSGLKIKQKNSGPKLLAHNASKENLQGEQ